MASVWGSLSPLSHQSKIDDEREGERFPMIDVTCVDAVEGLYAVFMDEEGVATLVDAFVWTADVVADVTPLPSTLNHVWEQLEDVQEWRETRLETMAQES